MNGITKTLASAMLCIVFAQSSLAEYNELPFLVLYKNLNNFVTTDMQLRGKYIVKVDFEFNELIAGDDIQNIFCNRAKSNQSFSLFYVDYDSSHRKKMRWDLWKSSDKLSNDNMSTKKLYTIKMNGKDGQWTISEDGNNPVTQNNSNAEYTNRVDTAYGPLMFFLSYETGGSDMTYGGAMKYPAKIIFYRAEIYNDAGSLLHKLVPAEDTSVDIDNVKRYGLLDKAQNNKFYPNSGTRPLPRLHKDEHDGNLYRFVRGESYDAYGNLVRTVGSYNASTKAFNPDTKDRDYCFWSTKNNNSTPESVADVGAVSKESDGSCPMEGTMVVIR